MQTHLRTLSAKPSQLLSRLQWIKETTCFGDIWALLFQNMIYNALPLLVFLLMCSNGKCLETSTIYNFEMPDSCSHTAEHRGMMLQIFSAWQLKKQSVSLVDCQDSCMEQQKDKDWVTAWEYIWASLWPHLVENPNLQWHSELEGLDGFISGDHQFWRISSWSFLWSQHQRTVIIIAMHQRFKKAPYPLTGITMHHHPSICSTLEFVCR